MKSAVTRCVPDGPGGIFRLLAVFCVQCPALVQAHGLQLEVGREAAAVITVQFADGKPLAGQAYELSLPESGHRQQTGRSDAQGRIVFLPGNQTEWRLKVWTADGHGVDRRLTLPAKTAAPSVGIRPEPAPAPLATPVETAPGGRERSAGWPELVGGLGWLFGLFALWQFRRQRRPGPAPGT